MSWPLDAINYELLGNIGKGAFSKVCSAVCKANSTMVAIKIMELEHIVSSFEDILQEVQTMRMSDDINILRCYCSFVERDELWLVTQLMDKGSCLRVMHISKSLGNGEGMNEEWLAYILREALQGLRYLHNNGQIHRDIKSGNILLDSGGGVRLADFGVAGWTVARGQRQDTVKTFVGTPCYMAPEVMEQLEGYDYRADIWSLGITALELAKGVAPYAQYSPMRVLVLTLEENPPSLKSYSNDKQRTGAPFPQAFEDFYKKCLQKNPRNRPTAEELLKHKFLRNRTPEALVNQLLCHIPTVGKDKSDKQQVARLPGAGSVVIDSRTVVLSPGAEEQTECETLKANGVPSIAKSARGEEIASKYVPGATWVFDSDEGQSVVFSRPSATSEQLGARVMDVYSISCAGGKQSVDEFMDDFEAEVLSKDENQLNALPGNITTAVVANVLTSPMGEVTHVSDKAVQGSFEKQSTDDFMDELEDIVDGFG